jgi:hypothetical protein
MSGATSTICSLLYYHCWSRIGHTTAILVSGASPFSLEVPSDAPFYPHYPFHEPACIKNTAILITGSVSGQMLE